MSASTIPFMRIYEDIACYIRDRKLKEKKTNNSNKCLKVEKPKNIPNNKKKAPNGDEYYDIWVMFNNNA